MTEDVLTSNSGKDADTLAEIDRLFREMEQLHQQNAENHRRIERARARTQENIILIRAQLEKMAA